jgi:DNA-directed RNA polymerase specialized sigma24 family protein
LAPARRAGRPAKAPLARRKPPSQARRPREGGGAKATPKHGAISFTGLTADHKIVIALRFLDDQSIEEIAARTRVRAGTVKSRLQYGLRELRAGYEAAERSGSRSDR